MEEIELIRKVQEGNMKAFEELFEHYKYVAMRTAYLMTGNKYTSEDIVQEAFTKCYFSIKTLRNPEYFKTWFLKLLTHITWRYMKKEKAIIPTAEEKAAIDKEELMISYGADEVTTTQVQHISWYEDGISYRILTDDYGFTRDELINMAKTIIDVK